MTGPNTELTVGIVAILLMMVGAAVLIYWITRAVARTAAMARRGVEDAGEAVGKRVRAYAYAREKRAAMRREGMERARLERDGDYAALLKQVLRLEQRERERGERDREDMAPTRAWYRDRGRYN